jgi:hypothetical protein
VSTQCNNVEILSSNAYIDSADAKRLFDQFEDELPEICFLDDIANDLGAHTHDAKPCRFKKACGVLNQHDAKYCKGCGKKLQETPVVPIPLSSLSWCGSGSQHSFEEVLIKHIVPCIKGELQAVFTWESGTVEGLAIKNGKVVVCDVVQTLKLPKGW